MIKLVRTSGACPESYDAYIDGKYVGYLYLRHGGFLVVYKGQEVFSGEPQGDGIFEYDERELWLNRGCNAILLAHSKEKHEIVYEICSKEEINDDY